mmetsp:Transcript_17233/g.25465  ORF Transcript_17233/g.25465 Transcript_17233/m.25465 type:complete len:490 (-) Transcript_17233:819-2288(-)
MGMVPFSYKSTSIVATFIFVTCVKILCIPAYRSTDFDVHRNWLAITRNLPLKKWYFDDINKTTVHTLDYPPSFSFFEYLISTSPLTNWLVSSGRLDERCLALLPDYDNDPSEACVVFHRGTVILSDIILWIGAFSACKTYQNFLLTVLNPGLLWLDHVHFQYNGAMLGILIGSLGQLVKGKNATGRAYHYHHMASCFLYSLLLTMKHLYLPLAPLYFIYILSTYCLRNNKLLLFNFLSVAAITAGTLLLPFLPFLIQKEPIEQMLQIASRLFPFARGLVHDYWAANVWAIWMLADKLAQKVAGFSLPEISPSLCALLLITGLLPGLYCAWKATPRTFLYCVVFCGLSSFMLAYHVHEKAIMTAIIPLATFCHDKNDKRLFLRLNTFGLVGLFPLLFRPIELPLKLMSLISYMALTYHLFGEIKMMRIDWLGLAFVFVVVWFLEIFHPIAIFPRMEFLPLLCTSITCALGLIVCWISAGNLMVLSSTLQR